MKRLGVIILMFCACNLQAQNLILNGSFENNTATTSMINLLNVQYNAVVASSSSFGDNITSGDGDIDLFKTGEIIYSSYPSWSIEAQEGDWFIVPSAKGFNYIDINGDTLPFWFDQNAFSLELSDTLTTGSWYTLIYYIKYKHPPGGYPNFYLPGRLSVGMSHYADSFGVIIDTSAYTDTIWQQQNIHFQATDNFAHITCRPVREQFGGNWAFVDNFVLVFDSTGIYTPPPLSYNCNNNACIDPGDGSGAYATLSACQTACITSINEMPPQEKQLLKIIDVLGKETKATTKGQILFYLFSDGTVEKRIFVE